MEQDKQRQEPDKLSISFTAPPFPATSAEFITVLAHYHRAEIGRMAGWRDRIDRTTNWAITGVAAMLSLSLSTSSAHHGVLLFAVVLVMLLLLIEARRYRFFDVYRRRVRLMERNYFAPMFAPAKEIKRDWAESLGEDLRQPKFLMSIGTAMSRRLRRNYIWMFLILLLAWIVKISTPELQQPGIGGGTADSLRDIVGNASLGPLPGWIVLIVVALFYAWIVFAAFRGRERSGELSYGDVHV